MAGGHWVGRLALITSLLGLTHALAQPTIVSTVPAADATDVSTTAPVVFTFSEAMDPTATSASFLNDSTFAELTTTPVWSAGNTVLSCTPSPAFPAGATILWFVSGQDPDGNALGGIPTATFTTAGAGGGGGGSGTNKYTSFAVGQAIYYDQTSAGAPTFDTNFPYIFLAEVILSSNRTALSATVKLPSGSVSNLFENPVAPEDFFLDASNTNQTTLDTTFASGDYIFTVVAATSNQQVTVSLPASLVQPGAPDLTSYTAAQSVNPAQPFKLTWDAFAGGTAADFIYLTIGTDFGTPMPGTSNALPGTATSVQIPAGTLQPNTTYNSSISFYRLIAATNKNSYTTAAFRDSVTQFSLITTAGSATTPLILTNASWSGHTFSFNVTSAVGQSLIIQYNTSVALNSSLWQTLLTTNSATGVVHVSDSVNTGNPRVLYRAQSGP